MPTKVEIHLTLLFAVVLYHRHKFEGRKEGRREKEAKRWQLLGFWVSHCEWAPAEETRRQLPLRDYEWIRRFTRVPGRVGRDAVWEKECILLDSRMVWAKHAVLWLWKDGPLQGASLLRCDPSIKMCFLCDGVTLCPLRTPHPSRICSTAGLMYKRISILGGPSWKCQLGKKGAVAVFFLQDFKEQCVCGSTETRLRLKPRVFAEYLLCTSPFASDALFNPSNDKYIC